ncbi:MAG: hypothetical protein ACLP5H_30315 [Desulfomonilaceae bacterium]
MKMRAIFNTFCVVCLFCLCMELPTAAQEATLPSSSLPSAAAVAVTPLSGVPSTTQIKSNILKQKIRALNSQIQIAQTCISEASRSNVLFDAAGNRNPVPSTDIVNCSRTLEALLRQLASLNGQTTAVAQDAQREAAFLQTQQKQKTLQAQTSAQQKRRRVRGRAL